MTSVETKSTLRFAIAVLAMLIAFIITATVINNRLKYLRPAAVQMYETCMDVANNGRREHRTKLAVHCATELLDTATRAPSRGYLP